MNRISLAMLAATVWLAASFAAQAAGLGRLNVLSPLGQPLNAEIDIVSLQPGEEDGLVARLAPAEAFRQAGIEPSGALVGLRFAIVRRDGRPVLRITSPQPVNEPFLDLLVELEWSGGRLVREYTFLLDPPEYKGPQAIAAVPPRPAAPVAQPLPPVATQPQAKPAAPAQDAPPTVATQAPAAASSEKPESVAEKPAADRPAAGTTHEVKPGDTLGAIARAHLPPGVTLNQMLIAMYRANQDAFLRENINLVRAGRVLNLPTADSLSAVNIEDADRLVQSHRGEWEEYRSRLAARPAPADAASGQRAVTGKIEAKPEVPPPGASQEQLRLSKADPAKPSASQSRAARADDSAARERALKDAQSRVTDLEKNVADLNKLLEMKNQQLAELEKKAGVKPAPAAPAPSAAKPEPAKPEAKAAAKPEPAKPAAPVTAEASKPAPATGLGPVPVPEAKKAEPATGLGPAPVPEAKKAEAPKSKPKAAPPPPPPPPSLIDEFLDNPIALAGLGFILVLLIGYGLWAWRRKKSTHAKFQDSVLGAAGGGAAFSETESAAAAAGASQASVNQPVAGMEAEEVDPIAEADVYMAYGRDAQAEEILKEALQKDSNRIPVHAKLLEIYAKRQDTKAFEQTALKLKELTHGSGPHWEKAVGLGRSIDPGNGLYGGRGGAGTAAAAGAAAGVAAAAPTIDFDIGGGTTPGFDVPDITLDDQPKAQAASSSIDFDLGAATTPPTDQTDFTPEGTLKLDRPASDPMASSGLDFDLNIGGGDDHDHKPQPPPTPIAAAPAEANDGLDFDLNLDLGGDKPAEQERTAAPMDLSAISLDLGSAGEPSGESSNDPKWQEVATKLDLAKAYDEMGDKDGARELLNEVMQDGDAAQKGQAQQLLTKLG